MKPIILIAVIFCLWVLVVVVPKSVFFKNERTPNDYYDVIRNDRGGAFYERSMDVSCYTEPYFLSEKNRIRVYVLDKKRAEWTGRYIFYVPKIKVWDGKKWLHKGKWQEDFFRIAEGLKAEQEARDKAEKEAERKILEAYK